MIYWLLAVVIVIVVLIVYSGARRRKAVPDEDLNALKRCSFCSEEIARDAAVCKYCGRVVISKSQ